jgi:hypothetical protein
MEFVPFGQDGIPPTAGKATKSRMVYNLLELAYKKGFEAFNLLNILSSQLQYPPHLLTDLLNY